MLRDLLQMDLLKLRCYFNEDTCQVAFPGKFILKKPKVTQVKLS